MRNGFNGRLVENGERVALMDSGKGSVYEE